MCDYCSHLLHSLFALDSEVKWQIMSKTNPANFIFMHINFFAFICCQYRTAKGFYRDWAIQGKVKIGVGDCELLCERKTSPDLPIKFGLRQVLPWEHQLFAQQEKQIGSQQVGRKLDINQRTQLCHCVVQWSIHSQGMVQCTAWILKAVCWSHPHLTEGHK